MTTAPSHRPIHSGPSANRPVPAIGPFSTGAGFAATIDPIRVLRRHLWLLVASVIAGGVVGVGLFVLLDRNFPLYRGEVRFEVRPGLQDPDQLGVQEIAREDMVSRLANTEASLLLSRGVLSRAAAHREIERTQWGKQFMLPDGGFDVENAVDELERTLSASMMRGTTLFRLTWSAQHAPDVPIVLNRIRDSYITFRTELDEANWSGNIRLFEGELGRINDQIEDTAREIANFIREHGIQSVEGFQHHTSAIAARTTMEQIAQTTSALNMVEVALQQTMAKLRGTLEPDAEEQLVAEMDPVVRQQTATIAELKAHLREVNQVYKPGHPTIDRIERQIRNREIERDAKIERIIQRNLEAKHKELRDRVEQYRSLLDELHNEAEEQDRRLRDLAAATADYHALEARRKRLEADRDMYRNRLDQIDHMRRRAEAARVRVAMDAQLPRQKSFPKMEIVVPLCVLGTLFLTLGIVFLRELTDQRIKSASDLRVLPNVPGNRVLGMIPDLEDDPTNHNHNNAELIVRHQPMSVLAESYRQACAHLLPAVDRGAHQTILFLSGLPSAGTTTAISNLAASTAATGKRVLVVDANFRRPRLATAMGAPGDGPGLGDLLADVADIDQTIVETDCGVSVIPAGTPANRVFERLNNGNFESIVAELRGRFDLIYFDAPPAVVAGDAMVLANRLDAAVLVVRANQEQKGLVARLLGQLADARCEALGILLNRPRGTAGGYFKKNFQTMAKYSRA